MPLFTSPFGADGRTSGARGYNPIFGGVPNIPSAGATQGSVNSIINSAIPGFNGLTQTGTQLIQDLMSGKLSPGTVNEIQDAGAAQAAASGVPGASREFGSVFADQVLRNIGTASEKRQQQGFGNLLSLLQGYSGTAMLTPAQIADQQNTRATYDAAPIPAYAIPYMMDTYKNAAGGGSGNPATGRSSAPGPESYVISGGKKYNMLDPFESSQFNWNRNRFL